MLGGAICSCDNDECLSAHAHSMLQVMQGVPTLLALEWGAFTSCIILLVHMPNTLIQTLWNPRVILAEKVMALVS